MSENKKTNNNEVTSCTNESCNNIVIENFNQVYLNKNHILFPSPNGHRKRDYLSM